MTFYLVSSTKSIPFSFNIAASVRSSVYGEYMLDTNIHVLTCLNTQMTQQVVYCHSQHFTDEETEAHWGYLPKVMESVSDRAMI